MNAIPSLLTGQLDIWITAETEKKSGRGRSGSNGVNVYGVRKLRELILELAVRGKLVPQDPDDEPASELLKRIQVEKAKLVTVGKIKKDKPLPPITNEEKPFELPQGWEWVTLASISLINPRNNAEDNSSASFVPMTMIGAKFNSPHDQEIRLWKEIKQGFTHFSENDIGVAKITPCFENSKACVFSGLLNGIGAGTTELHIIRPVNETLAPRYVLAYLKSPQFLLIGETRMTGTAGQKRLPKEFVELNPFPLPPLAEQHRIVAKVDELMALCDQLETRHINAAEAHEKLVNHLLGTLTQSQNANDFSANWQRIAAHFDMLFTTEASIDALKQTLLQLAVMGKLVPQNPDDEPASELLKRIQAEKAKLMVDGKIKKDKPLPPITEEEKSFELPQGWEWVRLADLAAKITDGTHHTPTYVESGIPFLSVKDMSSGILDFSSTRFISANEHDQLSQRCNPQYGDLLLTKVGTTGIPVIVDTDKSFSIFVSVALIKAPWELVSVEYLRTIISSPFVKKQSDDGTEGIGNKNLVLRKIANFLLVIPPLHEQRRVVAKVDELMVLCDQLKSRIAQSGQLQKKLADAVVEQAIAS